MNVFLKVRNSRGSFLLFYVIAWFFWGSPSLGKCKDLPTSDIDPYFRGHTLTANNRYLFAVSEGRICIKRRRPSSRWHKLRILPEMKGKISEISLDGTRMVAKSNENKIFLMKEALKETSKFKWTGRWGSPFGWGTGLPLPKDVSIWDFSFLSPEIDKSYVDSMGQDHMIGVGVGTLFAVRGDAQNITYFDPWLPADESYGVCGPLRGQLRIAALSTIGSTLAVMDKYGNIFIRRYDFDISGADTIVFDYTYEMKTPRSGFLPWVFSPRKLPVPDWVRLPRVPGPITNKISLEKMGSGAKVRVVRVEGMKYGRTGYYEVIYNFISRSPDLNIINFPVKWKFVETNRPLEGKLIENYFVHDDRIDIGPSQDEKYEFVLNKESETPISIELLDFNLRCSPATMRISFGSLDDSMDLYLHVTDKIRFLARKTEGDERPLKQNGTIEVPGSLLNNLENLSQNQREFLENYLQKKIFTPVKLSIRKDKIRLRTRRIRRTELFPMSRRWKFTKAPQQTENHKESAFGGI